MPKKSLILRNNKRKFLYEKFKELRLRLKKIILSKNSTLKEKFNASVKLSSLPTNSSRVRFVNRCFISGRARGLCMFREFGLSRIKLRELAGKGELPGVTISSW